MTQMKRMKADLKIYSGLKKSLHPPRSARSAQSALQKTMTAVSVPETDGSRSEK